MRAGQRVAAAVATLGEDVGRLESLVDDVRSDLSQEEWLDLVRDARALGNRFAAVEDRAIASAARFEQVWQEDGTVGTVDRGPGRVALDAADLVAPRLAVSHHQAERRVETAVRLTGREPVEVGAGERSGPSGLDGLHAAMRAGRLDHLRASVVADELAEAPADVAEAVVSALEPHLGTDPAAALRRRTRRLLGRISPDLLVRRADRARRETGLRRWAAEPGVDAWYGTFPTERSAEAWAAIDTVARQYVVDGVCGTIEQARGRALTDLVVQHADVRVQLVLTRPVATEASSEPGVRPEPDALSPPAVVGSPAGPRGEDLVQVHGIRPGEPLLVERRWLDRVAADPRTDVVEQPCDPVSGARVDPDDRLACDGYRPGARLVAMVRARDGRCRFPGCSVAARFCDLDHVRPWPLGPTATGNLVCLCRRHHRVKQGPGWRVRLQPDGIVQWTDPTGVTRTTHPVDALEVLVLAADPGRFRVQETPVSPEAARARLPSVLEEACRHRLDQHDVGLARRRCSAEPRPSPADARRRRWETLGDVPPF
jgi:hypothetical protein